MNSLREFSVIAIIIASCLIFTQASNATPYPWNQNAISPSWTVVPINSGMTISDINRDGLGDVVYTLSGTTMTRQFGTLGVASFSIHTGSTSQGVIYVKENRILSHNNNGTCGAVTARQYDLLTGTQLNQMTGIADAGGPVTIVGLVNKNNKTALACARATVALLTVNDSPNVNGTFVANPAVGGPYIIGFFTGAVKEIYTYENTLYSNSTITQRTMVKSATNTLVDAPAFPIPANIHVDNNIKLYSTGLNYPQRYFMTETLLSSRLYLINQTDTMSLLVNLPPRILHSSFTTPPVYLKLSDGTTTYFGALLGTNLYYTNYNTLVSDIQNNRALANYRIDSSQAFRTTAITSAIPTTTLTLSFYNGTIVSYASPPQTLLTTGYHFTTTTSLRQFFPDYTNSTTYIPMAEFSGPQTTLTLIISHAPIDGAIMLNNATLYNNTNKFTQTVTYLQADKSTTVSLGTNMCFDVYVKDTSDPTNPWSASLGILCNNGPSTKTLPFLVNLPLTFWTLQYGATHDYDSSSNTLSTIMRSSTTPFTYNIIIKNSTGSIAVNNTYSGIVDPLDARSFNVTTVSKPASLYITVGGNQIYSAFLGSTVSLAAVASFFHQYFSYQGFDLLSFIPIIFAAMYTRNTVGIGTVLVVVCIATISWLSIVTIPDLYVTVMAIIAVIGLIGYRLAYPN